MRHTARRDRALTGRLTGISAALVLGGVALVGVRASAEADASGTGRIHAESEQGEQLTSVISCPDVRAEIPDVPTGQRAAVDDSLAVMDSQLATANQTLVNSTANGRQDPGAIQQELLGPLRDQRLTTIRHIVTLLDTSGQRQTMEALAPCTLGERASVGSGAGRDGVGNGNGNGSDNANGNGQNNGNTNGNENGNTRTGDRAPGGDSGNGNGNGSGNGNGNGQNNGNDNGNGNGNVGSDRTASGW
ncbi:hypothetical protein AB0M29_23485 [Streptomyces sp. NPDC051976]|uniref:hypothetical protein n=1 Tax=Streptomyces sp. NPDC051976 TaxID=3154947 RepID=UPI0034127602